MFSDYNLNAALQSGRLDIRPWNPKLMQPASVDLRLGNKFKVMLPHNLAFIDPALDQSDDLYEDVEAEELFVGPGQFVLATTAEYVGLDDSIYARIEGKSSLGRLGLLVHSTAGFIDPGFNGQVTLEIGNISPLPIKLYHGMPICQLAVGLLEHHAIKPYSGKYQGQIGPQGSAYWKNFQPGGIMYRGEE
jgi:dCTP deaminase